MKRRETFSAIVAFWFAVAAPRLRAQSARRDLPARIAILDDAPEATRAQYSRMAYLHQA